MRIQKRYIIVFSFACWIATACNPAKHLGKDEILYKGATVKLKGDDLSAREKKVLKSDLQGLTRPKPNSGFLGLKPKLAIYNMFRKKKDKSFWGKIRAKYGEPPVLLSDVDLEHNVKVLQSHLENKGFFKVQMTGDTVVKDKTAHAEYTAETGPQYSIKSVRFENDSSQLARGIQKTAKESLLKVDESYDLDVIKGERLRIDAQLKENGFYYFSPNYLLLEADSTNGNEHKVDMRMTVKPETPDEARQAWRINNVYIYTGYNLNQASADTNKANAQFYKGYYVIDRRKRYRPILFSQAMMFEPGELYNRAEHNMTLNRLINLGVFKFVKNRFEPVEDSAKLDVYYYLTPMPKKSLRAEINANTKSNNLNGTQLSLNWLNRNAFKAGEHLSLTGYVGSEIQFGGTFRGYNTFRSGAEGNLAFPRFIVPFMDIDARGGFVPRTNFQLGYDILNRMKLYTVNSFRGGFGYLWKESLWKQHELYPVSINYVQSVNVTKEFLDSVGKYPFLQRVIDKQFILGSTYQYNMNQLAMGVQKLNSYYLNALVDLSGNIAGLVTGANVRQGKQKSIFNTPFDQYIKIELDGRYYRRIGLKSTFANRVILGFGQPYGNSLVIPYIKQYFAGGNNSVRAFRSRSLGPGTFRQVASKFLVDQTGDLKLELNTEYRPHIMGPLYGALFVDAGNIWLANEDPNRPGAKFTSKFLNELAVGGGVGVRVDITIFVIRLDVGIPFRKPWEQNPWVINQIKFNDKEWKRDNIIYNLAIGYPF